MATYNLTSVSMPATLAVGDILNCPYSGDKVSIVLPAGKYKLECWGAQGGYRSSTSYGGKGGYSKGTLVTESDIDVFLYAGGAGGSGNSGSNGVKPGGFNGGGYRYKHPGGGGASDIRLGTDSLYARVIVAGGGGSDGSTSKAGGYGGGTVGESRTDNYSANSNYCGKGGNTTYSGYSSAYTISTQATSGLNSNNTAYYCGGFGFGGGGVYLNSGYGGAGGGGWYGGAGNVPDTSSDDDRGGGGGSGYVYTSATASQYPSGCLLTANNYLLDATTHAGNTSFANVAGTGNETGHTGNGAVKITVLEVYSDGSGTTKIRKEKIRIQHKGDTEADWNPNYILMRREIGVETDTGRMKIGNGVTPWSKLPYTKVDGFTTPQMLDVYLDSEQAAWIGNGSDLAVAGVWGVLPIEKGGTGAIDVYSALENLGAAPELHSTSNAYAIGAGTTTEYGHNRIAAAGEYFGPMNGYNMSYSQQYIDFGYVVSFGLLDLCFGGQYGINFDMSTNEIPATLLADAEGSNSSTVFMGILNTYNIDNVNGLIDGKTVKQQLIIPEYNLTYERYVTVDTGWWEATGTTWINTSRQGAPSEKIDFANKGGGRLYYMGRQPVPELEKAFSKPEDDAGTYVGQLSEGMGGWHVTVNAAIPTITIKRYNADKTQSSTKTITVDSAYGASKSVCMDKENGRIFLLFYQATNYPYGGAVQFQISGSAIDSTITKEATSTFSANNWNSSGSERQFGRTIAFNNTCFFTTTSGGYEGNYAWDDYVCLSKITSVGSVSSGISRQGYYNGLYTNGTDLYVEYEDDASTSSYPTRYYEYIFKYPNGDLSNGIEIWNDTYYSDDRWSVEMYIPQADKFILENREKWSDSWDVSYYSVSNSGTRTGLSTGGNIITIIGTSENYMIIQLQGAYDGWAYKETGNGIGLVNLSTGQLDFIDIYCNSVLSYARFDEDTNNFYIGTKDNYEFIYTIV